MIYVYLICCLAITIYAFIYTNNIGSPLFINSIVWLVSYILILAGTSYEYIESMPLYGIFLFADLAFTLGFLKSTNKHKNAMFSLKRYISFKKEYIAMIFSLEYIIASVILVKIISNTEIGNGNIWLQVRRVLSNGEMKLNVFERYYTNFAYVLLILCFCIFLSHPNQNNKRNLLIQIYPVIMVLLITHRGNWFMLFISLVFSYIYVKRPKNKEIVRIGGLFVFALMLLIIISMYWKFSEALGKSMNDNLSYLLKVYFVSPFGAFIQRYGENFQKSYGLNTFRFIFAILRPLGFNVTVVELVQPFIYVDGLRTNVFTDLGYYMEDFGIPGVLIVEFFLGFIFGKIYKKTQGYSRETYKNICILSFLMYGVANQFFDNKFLSITSTWIQIFFWSWILSRKWLLQIMEPGNKSFVIRREE